MSSIIASRSPSAAQGLREALRGVDREHDDATAALGGA
jgi:hypothetical protein